MASRRKSIRQKENGLREHQRGAGRYDREGAQDQTPILSGYCAVCFLTFGSQEKRAVWRGRVVHPRCLGKLRPAEAS